MNQLNLRAENIKAPSQRMRVSFSGGTSIMLGALALLISVGIYGAIYSYNAKLKRDIVDTNQQLAAKQARLNSQEFVELYHFQDRLTELKSRMDTKVDYGKNMDKLAMFTLADAYYDTVSLKTESGLAQVDLSVNVPDYDQANKQTKAYTLIYGIQEFNPSAMKKKEDGSSGISMQVSFSIAPQSTSEATNGAVVNQ